MVVHYLSKNFGRIPPATSTSARKLPARPLTNGRVLEHAEITGLPDWPTYGHDPGGLRYSSLAQINKNNVARLTRAWTYHHGETGRNFEVSPIVVADTMYFTTPSQRVIAVEPETGQEIWQYDPHVKKLSAHRGVSYWPGDSHTAPRILLATTDGRLMALDPKTGKLIESFGDNGEVNLRTGVADNFPTAGYSITSPPAIYRNLAILGPELQEGPSQGPSGDPRAFDVRTGKLVWRFHVLPRPGEKGNETWGPDGWKNRSGPSVWGGITVDTQRGIVFLPVGNPADNFYGADRPGKNLYANCVVALDASTGKLRWYYQMVHHDIFDYDVAAPPALIEVNRDGEHIPAVAEITKMGLLFILDRLTGKPIFGVEERPVPKSDVPGEKSWPTQPFPLKPPPLARNSVTMDELSTVTPSSRRFCEQLLAKYPNQGPYTPFSLEGSTLFPGTLGGGNWGGVSFDPQLGYIFVSTSSLGAIGRMVKARAGATLPDGRPVMPYRNESGYARFVDGNHYPCNQPPWGELIAVNANLGEIVWRVALGSYPELEGKGIENTGAPALAGSIATAGGLVFVAGTNDARFRAFDSGTGRQLWVGHLDDTGNATPITYMGRDGKQYVVITSGSSGHLRSVGVPGEGADSVIAFSLP